MKSLDAIREDTLDIDTSEGSVAIARLRRSILSLVDWLDSLDLDRAKSDAIHESVMNDIHDAWGDS